MSSVQLSTRASQGSSITIDSFQTFSASKGSESESRLERHRRARKPIPDIATALSPSGWLATASYDKVRFYRLGDTDRSAREIKENRESIKCHREWGKIRAIAISNDLLAIITYSHLIVLEYRVHGNIDQILVDTKLINPSEAWTPQSVAIRQVENLGAGLVPISWIAVGGQGKHGVKVYKYTYSAGWDAQSDRITLSCAQNASSIRLVGFSPDRPNTRDQVIVFGASDSNRIYCWGLGWENENRTPEPSWIFNCDVRKGGVPHWGAIKSAQIFLSPSGRAYMFCAINQRQGSQILRSCTAPFDDAQRDERTVLDTWQELPGDAIGRSVLCGTVTPNGQFIIAVEQGLMRLLTLQPAGNGGLGCITVPKPLEWRSSLAPTSTEVSGISVSVREEYGALEIVAVDGRGNVEFRCVNVRDMPPLESPQVDMLPLESPRVDRPVPQEMPNQPSIRHEMPDQTCIRKLIGESSSGEHSWYSGSTEDRVFDEDRIEKWEIGDPAVPAYGELYHQDPSELWAHPPKGDLN